MRETIVSGVSCAPTDRPTASLSVPHLAQTKSVCTAFSTREPQQRHDSSSFILKRFRYALKQLHFSPLDLRSSALNIGQEPLPEAWATYFSPLSAQVRHRGGALHSLATCDTPPHLQQASFLSGSVQPRDTWPYPWHLKHRETSTCSRIRQFTHPTLRLPSLSNLWASASIKRTTAVCTRPKRFYRLH